MFVKLIKMRDELPVSDKEGNKKRQDKPHNVLIHEATSVRFQKHSAEYFSYSDDMYIPFGKPTDDGEYLEIFLGRENKPSEHIVASGCALYVMNSEGKTVDSISCAV